MSIVVAENIRKRFGDVEVLRDGDDAVLRVTDTGNGIPADMLSRPARWSRSWGAAVPARALS